MGVEMNNKEKAEKYDILDCITLVEKCPCCGEQIEVKMTVFKCCSFKVGLCWECPKCHKDFYIENIKLGAK